ncbi:hypothetical protein [Pseudanabaena mucicola]|uniref:hypothetical protein n=1 Tax=Pseudanabaena mucicola TaxID=71190 RepID=UPI0025768834|nr:hypothetical protein [Pseudanabaena mucicola]
MRSGKMPVIQWGSVPKPLDRLLLLRQFLNEWGSVPKPLGRTDGMGASIALKFKSLELLSFAFYSVT